MVESIGRRNRPSLRKLLSERRPLRFLEAHNGISALIVENAKVSQGENAVEYDGIWVSSLTDAAAKGIPDAELPGPEGRILSLDEIVNVTTKPIIVDVDTGGSVGQFQYFLRKLEQIGVSGIIVEDKTFPKLNSLDPDSPQNLEDSKKFADKIRLGRQVVGREFFIIARIESLIAGVGLDDAIRRAAAYIEAGCDGIMIHSKSDGPEEVLAFASQYAKLCSKVERTPSLVCVPTTYNAVTDEELARSGFDVVIHANQLLRSSYKAMKEAAETILLSDRGLEAEAICAPISEIFREVGFYKLRDQDQTASRLRNLSIIIPAAGRDMIFPMHPKSLIPISGKPVLDYQLETLRNVGLKKVILVRGYQGRQFRRSDVTLLDNPQYAEKHILHSVFVARNYMKNEFLLVMSDILFNGQIIQDLLNCHADVALVVDNSYRFHKDVQKPLDLVISRQRKATALRTLNPTRMVEVLRVGRKIPKELADHEFAGIAYFSESMAKILPQVYDDCSKTEGRFHDAESFATADITDFIQELIDRGFRVNGLEVFKGWMEIHTPQDVELAERELSERRGRLND